MSTPIVGPRVAHRLVSAPLRRLLRTAVAGQGHIPGTGGVILAANHRSLLDPIVMGIASPRHLYFLGKTELAVGLFGRLLQAVGMVPVDRGKADREAIGRIAALLAQGQVVGVFPEGTRSVDGSLYRFRSGVARLAAQTQVPVVPVGLIGTGEIWPRGQTLPTSRPAPGAVRVSFGAPLAAPADEPAARKHFTESLAQAISELCGQPRADRFLPLSAA